MIARHRTQGSLKPGHAIQEIETPSGTVTYNTTTGETGSFRVTDDFLIPGFHKRVAKGEVFFNPFSSYYGIREQSGLGYEIYVPSTLKTYSLTGDPSYWLTSTYAPGHYPALSYDGMWIYPVKDLSRLIAENATSNYANCGNLMRSNNFETLAEMHKTWAMLRHPIRTFVNFDKKFANRIWKTPAQAWLAYRYGVKPLVSSVVDVALQARKLHLPPKRITCRDSMKVQYNDTLTANPTIGAFRMSVITTRVHKISIRATILNEVHLNRMNEYGLSAKQLITLPWELVPYSFVVDWFVNVGDFLNAMTPIQGFTQLGACQAIRSDITWETHFSNVAPVSGAYVIKKAPTGNIKSQILTCDRYAHASPSLVIKDSILGNNVKTRIGDGLALVGQLIAQRMASPRLSQSGPSKGFLKIPHSAILD